MICTIFVGWLLFAVFAGVGFVSLPWDLFIDYMYRPKQIDEGNFEERKQLLLKYALDLRDTGKKLDENRNYVNQIRGFQGFTARYQFGSDLRSWETKCMQCELEFTKLNQQTDFVNKVEPLYYTGKLCLGILCVVLTSTSLFLVVFGMLDYWLSSEQNSTTMVV